MAATRRASPTVNTVRLPQRRRAGLPVGLLPSARSLLVGLGIVAAAAGAYVVARETPMFAIERIEVRGGHAAEVERALAPLRGRSLVGLSGNDVLRRLQALPDVVDASYDRAFPHTLRLLITPEQPVAVLRRGAQWFVISARARVIAQVTKRAARGLPLVVLAPNAELHVGSAALDARAHEAALSLALLLGDPLPQAVREVSGGGPTLTFVLASGLRLDLGGSDALALKLAVARRILPLLAPGTRYLDLTVPDRPVSGLNSQPGG